MAPRQIDYNETCFYKLCCKDISITEIYIGHTTDMRKRKWQHKSSCNNEKGIKYNLNVYKFIRDNGGWDNWDMIEIERFEAIDGYDATKRERYWIETLKASLNSYIPTRTNKEYREDNKEIIAEQRKEHYEKNKEKIIEYQKEYRENNSDNLKEYEKNRKNKEERLEKAKEKITCECGCLIRKDGLAEHKKNQKHINLMSQLSKSSIIIRQSATDLDTTVI